MMFANAEFLYIILAVATVWVASVEL